MNVCYHKTCISPEHFKIDRDHTDQVKTSSLKDLRLGSPVSKEAF